MVSRDAPRDPSDAAYHEPVLVEEVTRFLESAGTGTIMDGTVGGGGHARALLERYPDARVMAVDRDPEALAHARRRLESFGDRVRFVHARFDEALDRAGAVAPSLDGVLLDLGVSTWQVDRDERGFTFRSDAPLDMRMGGEGQEGPGAAEVLNEKDETELARILFEYGEERRSRRIAAEVVRRREVRPLRTAGDLVDAMAAAFGRPPATKEKARVFQAIRIEVNRELEALDRALSGLDRALVPGGVAVVIAYHSLEDRRVKNAFREWSRTCTCPPELPVCVCGGTARGKLLTRRVVRPSDTEIDANPRARSARLRAWRKAA